MPKLHQLAALAAALVVLVFAAVANAAPVTVNLRVEGSGGTLFEGPITTDAKTLTKDSSGSHPCDGTNGNVNPTPGPTMTGAMDDGASAAGFTWDGTWDDGFQDFFINRIGPDTNTGSPDFQPYWGYFLNWVTTNVGGCQQQVAQGDDVLFAYGDYGEPLLQLSAPARAATGESFTVSVQQNDGNGNRTVAPGVAVGAQTTDAQGHATLAYNDAGAHTFKAFRSGSIRSNAASVCVYVPGSGDCGTEPGNTAPQDQGAPSADQGPTSQPAVKDTTPPVVHITGTGPRLLSGDVQDDHGIAQVFLRLRKTTTGGTSSASKCRWFSGKRGVFTHRVVPCSRARFFRIGSKAKWSYLLPSRLHHGRYVLDVKVLDTSYNAGRNSAGFKVG